MSKRRLVKIAVRVTSQTAYNLRQLQKMGGVGSPGKVIDKLVRDRMIALSEGRESNG